MKKLYLIRHAKSSWKDMTLDDFDRPLNKRGKLNAPFMAKFLKTKGIYPDLILSSPAKRAKATAKAFKENLKFKDDIVYESSLYHASQSEIETVIINIDNWVETAFLFAHNPTLNIFVEEYLDMFENIPTCGIVGIGFNTDSWESAFESDKELLMFDYPKNHYNSEHEA